MDLYCIICGCCSWSHLADTTYYDYLKNLKDLSEDIKTDIEENNIDDKRLVNYVDKYTNNSWLKTNC